MKSLVAAHDDDDQFNIQGYSKFLQSDANSMLCLRQCILHARLSFTHIQHSINFRTDKSTKIQAKHSILSHLGKSIIAPTETSMQSCNLVQTVGN
jgi:hypothetical protein